MEQNTSAPSPITAKRLGWWPVTGLLVLAVVMTAGLTFLVLKTYFFPSAFKPVTLKPAEEKVLAAKLEKIDAMGAGVALRGRKADERRKAERPDPPGTTLEPEPYTEIGAQREIAFTERELNGLLAKNTDLATKLAIDLSDDLVSAKLLLPVDEDFPVIGGQVLRLRSGVVFTYHQGKPVVMLKGITIMGVPVPNAWLGGMKNIDLVEKFGTGQGFWKTFSDGIEDIKVEEGRLKITLKE